MNKVLRFARSMRFGLILLLPVLVCSVLGSVIPQGESESYYAAQFPQAYHLILGLGLDRMFATPVFLILTGLFGVNLALCTVNQYRNVPARTAAVARRAAESGETEALSGEKAEKLRAWLRHHRWRRTGERRAPGGSAAVDSAVHFVRLDCGAARRGRAGRAEDGGGGRDLRVPGPELVRLRRHPRRPAGHHARRRGDLRPHRHGGLLPVSRGQRPARRQPYPAGGIQGQGRRRQDRSRAG